MGVVDETDVLERYPIGDILTGEWVGNGCGANDYACLQDNNNYLSTDEHQGGVDGEYNLQSFNIPLGHIINEVKIQAECRSLEEMPIPGYIYMRLRKAGVGYRAASGISVDSTWEWKSYVFSTSFSGGAWQTADLDGLSYELDALSPKEGFTRRS